MHIIIIIIIIIKPAIKSQQSRLWVVRMLHNRPYAIITCLIKS